MANTRQEISLIHTRGLATPNKKYYRDDGQVFIGTESKRLRLLDKAELTTFKPSIDFPQKNVQTAVESVNSKLVNKSKQVEIDFGPTLYTRYKIFTISDENITEGCNIIASIAYDAPTYKSLDEIEMDPIICTASTTVNGSFKLLVRGLEGSLRNKFKINYTISWQ